MAADGEEPPQRHTPFTVAEKDLHACEIPRGLWEDLEKKTLASHLLTFLFWGASNAGAHLVGANLMGRNVLDGNR